VIHWRLPFMVKKYAFHDSEQERLNLTIHDWPPASVALTHGNGSIDVCETYQVGSGAIKVMRGTEPFEAGKPWVCGKDWLNRPLSAELVSGFDVLFCGHKSSDEDPLTGPVPLNVDVKQLGLFTTMWFPLREWTDSDISEFIKSNNVPFDRNRYDDDVASKKDRHMNSDYAHACMRCVDKREGQFVRCPKLDLDIENIALTVNHEEPIMPYCNTRTGLQDVRSLLQPQVELANPQEGSAGFRGNTGLDASEGLPSDENGGK